MAEALWGNVYYQDHYAGILREEPGGRCAFAYDQSYIEAGHPAISLTLPLTTDPIITERGLHPFFDNLVAEGWLQKAQARALAVPPNHRFALLLAFGHDLTGAVSVRDPSPKADPNVSFDGTEEVAALASRASISGVQPKLLAVQEGNTFRPARRDERSTHIAKLSSGQLEGIVDNEYLTMLATRTLLPEDRVAEVQIREVAGIAAPALLVRRFDRTDHLGKMHFEEFNQIFNRISEQKYEGAYGDMARFISENPRCTSSDIDLLFRRVLVCILVGNADAHMKNFGLLYTIDGLRLAPIYDMVSEAIYPNRDMSLALRIGQGPNPGNLALTEKHLVALTASFGLKNAALKMAVESLGKRLEAAKEAIMSSDAGNLQLRKRLAEVLQKRWNGTFNLIGQRLSKKLDGGAKSKG
jgi:serine/threonine-protein kinase HipA